MYRRDARQFYSLMGRKSVALIKKAEVMAYKRKLIEDPKKRSQTNIRDKLNNLRTLLEWAAQNDLISDNPAKDVRMRVTEHKPRREDWDVTALNTLLAGPVHSQGMRPNGGAAGEAAYWLPLLAIFMGARREELGQLRVPDVRLEQYPDESGSLHEVWCINITDEGAGNSLKNTASRRLVPLHPTLIELGFIRYVQRLPDKEGQVFPLLKRLGRRQRMTDKWGQWFTVYRRELGISDKKVFHGFRHTWKTQAVNAGIVERVARQFQGHEGRDVADKYGSAPSMAVMVAAIEIFRIPGLVLPKPSI
jgi:integrase